MDLKSLFGIISFAVMMIASIPYIKAVLKGETKPHLFSWIIWHVVDDIAVATQYVSGAEAGLWATLAGSVCSFFILFLAIQKRSAIKISRFDWIVFALALTAIPVWMLTKEPLYAAIIATAINASAFLITLRKVMIEPDSENALAYGLYSLGWIFGIIALGTYNFTTTLYPVVGMMMNASVFILIFMRKKILSK